MGVNKEKVFYENIKWKRPNYSNRLWQMELFEEQSGKSHWDMTSQVEKELYKS